MPDRASHDVKWMNEKMKMKCTGHKPVQVFEQG